MVIAGAATGSIMRFMIDRLRTPIFWTATLFMFGGPFLTQVAGYRIAWVKSWQPYGNHHPDVCVARYWIPGPEERPVSRLEVLYDTPYWWQVPLGERVLTGKKDVLRSGRKMCKKLGLGDLRTEAKCSTPKSFRYFDHGEVNLCRPGSTSRAAPGR